jgi:hypothetical protein
MTKSRRMYDESNPFRVPRHTCRFITTNTIKALSRYRARKAGRPGSMRRLIRSAISGPTSYPGVGLVFMVEYPVESEVD